MAAAMQRWQLSGGMAAWRRQCVDSVSSVTAAAVAQRNCVMAVEGAAAAWQRRNGSSISISMEVAGAVVAVAQCDSVTALAAVAAAWWRGVSSCSLAAA